MRAQLKKWFAYLQRLTGDDAYARYLAHHAAHHPNAPTLDRRQFYLHETERKWNGVKRCC